MCKLIEFHHKLKEFTNLSPYARPFLCEGTPFGSDIFLVGINPATSTNFWDHWPIETGCDKKGWIDDYLEYHNKFSPTRKRIEIFFENTRPLKILETNIFPFPSNRESDLNSIYRDTRLFDYLVETIQPKLILGHGLSTIKHLSKIFGITLHKGVFTETFMNKRKIEIRVENHFSYQWSENAIKSLANDVRNRYI